MKRKTSLLIVALVMPILILLFTWESAWTQGTKAAVDMTELAKKTQNPVEAMIQVPLGYYGNINWGPEKRFSTTLELKPVIPVKLSKGLNLIFRSIIPLVFLPSPVNKSGLTDIQLQFYFAPSKTKKFIWGIGPMVSLPTGLPYELCSGKWTAGPIGVGLFMLEKLVFGALVNQRWSFAGDGSMPDINQLYVNAFINYNFKHGWAISYAPEIYANWNEPSAQVWTLPV